jgi:hypothetical protein
MGTTRSANSTRCPWWIVKDDEYVKKTVDGITMEVSRTILETDFLISLPVLKGHCQTAMTCALKNMKGVLSDRSKRLFHTLGLNRPIAALNKVRAADLIIVDSSTATSTSRKGAIRLRRTGCSHAADSVFVRQLRGKPDGPLRIRDIPYTWTGGRAGSSGRPTSPRPYWYNSTNQATRLRPNRVEEPIILANSPSPTVHARPATGISSMLSSVSMR